MTRQAKGWVTGLAKYGIGFGLLAFVVWRNWDPKYGPPPDDGGPPKLVSPGLQGLLQQTPDWAAFAGLTAMLVCCTFVQYARWYVLVRAVGLPFAPRDAARLGLVGTFYNVFLPGSIGGDLVKAYFIAKDSPGRRAAAVATVVADRLVGLFGLIWFAAVLGGAYWLAGDPAVAGNDYLRFIVRVCAGLVGAAVAGWVLLGLLPQRRADRFAGRLGHIPKAGRTLAEVWYTVWTYRRRPRAVFLCVAMTAAVHVGFVLMFHLAVRVFPAPDPGTLAEHLVVAPVGFIAQAFFPAPGGVGGGEAIFGYLYTLLGKPEGTGVVGRLTLRVAEWSFGFVGYLAFLRMRAELPPVEAEAESEGYGGHEDPKVERVG